MEKQSTNCKNYIKFYLISCLCFVTGCTQQTNEEANPQLSSEQIEICSRLSLAYEQLEKGLGSIVTIEDFDDREVQKLSHRQLIAAVNANSTLNLMIARGCNLPKRAPSTLTYFDPATDCQVRSWESRNGLKSTKPEDACDRAKWQPSNLERYIRGGEDRLEAFKKEYAE